MRLFSYGNFAVNLEENKMTTKAKTTKPATRKPAVVKIDAVKVAHEIGKAVNAHGSLTGEINAKCEALRKAKFKVGTYSSDCAIMNAFLVEIKPGRNEGTAKNMASAFRKCVNDGRAWSFNPARSSSKRPTRASKSNETKAAVTLRVVKDTPEAEVAEALREAVNDEKFRGAYASLAAFLVDALDEYEADE